MLQKININLILFLNYFITIYFCKEEKKFTLNENVAEKFVGWLCAQEKKKEEGRGREIIFLKGVLQKL